MKTLTFYNEAILPPEAFQTMGLSIKEEGSFGMFGTGLKYAIATLLRAGDSIEIITGGQRFYFSVETREVRGKSFDFVQCNEQDIGFTTQLGKCWEPWMAYRELLCNARDEHGDVVLGNKHDATTQVIIRGDVLAEVHSLRSKWFLSTSEKPIWEDDSVQVFDKPTSSYFYQGVFVGAFRLQCPFTVNFKKGIHLSEDRLDKYGSLATNELAERIRGCDNEKILATLVNNRDFPLSFHSGVEPSEKFLTLCRKIYKRSGKFVSGMKETLLEKDETIAEGMEEPFTDREEKMLKKVCAFLERAGFPVSRFPMVKFSIEGKELLGHATGFEKISLTPVAFERGTFDLAFTVLEEFIHCDYKVEDYTREMQDVLFKAVLSQAEARLNEIL